MAQPRSAQLHGDADGFRAALASLVDSPRFSDVTFLVGRERREVFAHRCILACRCPGLRGLLDSPPSAPIALSSAQPEAFLAVLEFLYTNRVHLTSVTALEVLASSVEYGLDDLRQLCVEFVMGTLSVETACEALQAGVTCGQADLQQRCLAFIEDNTQAVVGTRGFHELSEAALVPVLRSDRLTIDETDLIAAVRGWARVSAAVFGCPVAAVADGPTRELRLPLLAPGELAALESQNQRDPLLPVRPLPHPSPCPATLPGQAPSLCAHHCGLRPGSPGGCPDALLSHAGGQGRHMGGLP
ncbi:PREDICTED: BTB/POZ domain-containing protein 19 isoform X2 [Gavialis gangeticus]|uniref:BTB/POZ domain-containing protein 19 isoform X2 n=1 Tax=Gavialis gangeticus TaxID=94835 RepID=UPI00092EBDAA|nr:PREDICTED: BTB/POZ domain-containing protein 19 isoform X2 [Gavialis gangeticus]